jgi:hypothetical protein
LFRFPEGGLGVERQRVYVNAFSDTAVLKCLHCGIASTRYVGEFKGRRRRVEITCACRSVRTVLFEFRRAQRKEVNFWGYYTKLLEGQKWCKMMVSDVSVTGIGLLVQSANRLSKGDYLEVRFTLDDRTRSRVEKKAVVRRVEDIHVGCEFMNPAGDGHGYGDAALDLYLMP